MRKIWIGIVILAVAVVALGVAGFAYAQSRSTDDYPHGPWMMGEYEGHGHGMRGFGHMGWGGEYGPMHEFMVSELAEALDLSPDTIEARHDAGETLWEIAAAQGLSDEETQELMLKAHDTALEQAIESGWLSEEQAEWMDGHMEGMWDGDYGYGHHCGRDGFNPPTNGTNQN